MGGGAPICGPSVCMQHQSKDYIHLTKKYLFQASEEKVLKTKIVENCVPPQGGWPLGHDPPGGERNLFIEMPELVRPQNNRVFPYDLNSPLELTCVSGL